MIVIVFGLPGSGKSFFASHLAERLGARYVNSDQARLKMYEHRSYSPAEIFSVYDHMVGDLRQALNDTADLVIDATFYCNAVRQKFLSVTKDIRFIEISAEETVVRKRLALPRQYSEAGPEVYDKMLSEWEPLELPHLVLRSTDSNIEEMLSDALRYLGSS